MNCLNHYFFLVCIILAYSASTQALDIALSVGPQWVAELTIFLPEESIASDVPLVTQSSSYIPFNIGSNIIAEGSFPLHKNLEITGTFSNCFVRHGRGLVRSFLKNPVDPTSARSVPFAASVHEQLMELDISATLNLPFNEIVKTEITAGYRYNREWDTTKFLQLPIIFFDNVTSKGPFIAAELSIEKEPYTGSVSYQFTKAFSRNFSTQNTDDVLLIQTVPTHAHAFSCSLAYNITEHITIEESIIYEDTKNTIIGTSTIITPGADTLVLKNLVRLEGKTFTIMLKLSCEF